MPPDVTPDPKSRTLDRPRKRYRRKVASRKQWEKIVAEKLGPCRACTIPYYNGSDWSLVEFHHVVSRQDGGDDVADNIVPLHRACHDCITSRTPKASQRMLESLSDAEYSYVIRRGGEDYAERAYGLVYSRAVAGVGPTTEGQP